MRRSLQLSLSLLAATALLLAATASTEAQATRTTFLKVKAAHAQRVHRTTNLSYHGGPIQQFAKVYIV